MARWRAWWKEAFTATPFWRTARAQWVPPVPEVALPASLLERFVEEDDAMRLVLLLDFVKPVTTSSGSRISMGI